MGKPPVNPYLRNAVLTATPEQLQLMLYDGAIRFALQGKDALLANDYEQSFEKLTRAQHIIIEMKKGLNFEVNPDLCRRVDGLYTFLYNKLVDACVLRVPGFVDDAVRVLRIERETWRILCDKVAELRRDEAGGPPAPFDTAERVSLSVEG